MLKIGIVGLPNVGKSTLFQALTRKQVAIANYPFTTIDPNVGVVAVPDKRLNELAELIKPERVVPATIEFVDIAGLVKGAHEGKGLGNQFLSYIYAVNAILFLLRGFRDSSNEGNESPEEQLSLLKEELIKKDEETRKNSSFTPLLSEKASLVICNIQGKDAPAWSGCNLILDCKLELEMSEMSDQELKEMGLEPNVSKVISHAYTLLNLITFYTIKGGKELHAWPIEKGKKASEAGGVVHSDFQEKFIRAEVTQCAKLLQAGSWARARELGLLRTEGKDYVVHDGDVLEFKI